MTRLTTAAILFVSQASAFTGRSVHAPKSLTASREQPSYRRHGRFDLSSVPDIIGSDTQTEISKAPTLNGKSILPVRAMVAGLKGHKVAAVYALLNSDYKRG
jgi:hypothetical protein